MKKTAKIIILSLLIASYSGVVFAANRITPTEQTTQPDQTTTDQPASASPNVNDPAAFDPAILQQPSSGTTTPATTVPPTEQQVTPTTDANNPPATTNAVPPRKTPGRTSTNTTPTTTQTPIVESPITDLSPTPEACPATNEPLTTAPCPTVQTVAITPQIPYALVGTSVLGLGLFWIILSYFSGVQTRSENRFTARHLATAHSQHVNQNKIQEYQNLLNHLTTELTSKGQFNVSAFQNISAKVQLLGSPEMQNLVSQINNSITSNDRKSLKPLVQQLALQIKKEL